MAIFFTSQMCHRQAMKIKTHHILTLVNLNVINQSANRHSSSLLEEFFIKAETSTALKIIYINITPAQLFTISISLIIAIWKMRLQTRTFKTLYSWQKYHSDCTDSQEELFRCWSRSVWSSPNSLSIFCFLPCNIRILLKSCAFSSDWCSDIEEFLLCEISLVSERLSACLLLSGTDCV